MNKEKPIHTTLKDIGFTLLSEGTILKIKACGYSMFPAIEPGSTIYIEPFSQENVPVAGEIIAWKRDSGFVVHRIVRKLNEGERTLYITRGDSCMHEDQPVPEDQIAGKVIKIQNNRGILLTRSLTSDHNPLYPVNRVLVWFVLRFNRIKMIFKNNLYTDERKV